MSVSYNVNLVQIICRFIDFGSDSFCNTWEWKLDPYRCLDKNKDDICLRNKQQDELFPDIVMKMFEVQNGFFLQQVFYLADGGTQWKYIRKKSDEILLSYYVNRDWSEVVLVEDHTSTGGNMAFEYLCHIMPACCLKQDVLTFHGPLLEHNGKGIILSAPSGTGKTTHAHLWRDIKHTLIINGDRSAVRKTDGIWVGFGLPWSGTSGEQINRSVPIKAIVVLERGNENEAHQITGLEAFGAVLPHILCPAWDAELTGKAMDLLNDFLRDIPVIRLQCRPDPESVEVLSKALEEL